MLPTGLSPAIQYRVRGAGGAPAPGFYWAADAYQSPIISALPTTLLSDGSPGDQTTFEESTANGIGSTESATIFRVWATPQALNSVSVRAVLGESTFAWVVERWTGSAWSTDINSGVGATPANFQPTWSTLTQNLNPALTTTILRVSILSQTDIGGGDGPVLRVGDVRIS